MQAQQWEQKNKKLIKLKHKLSKPRKKLIEVQAKDICMQPYELPNKNQNIKLKTKYQKHKSKKKSRRKEQYLYLSQL